MGTGLLERVDELARVDQMLDAATDGSGAVMLISGPAGIGKTCLLDACAEGAGERGMLALATRGDELGMESSFSATRELFAREVHDSPPDLFEGAAKFAAPVFAVGGAELMDPATAASVLHGLYWLLANLAERRPVVLLVDDAHWLDPASVRFLLYLARRVDSLPALLAVALREGEGSDPTGLAGLLSDVAADVLRPAPLSEEATGVLVRRELGARADDELCKSCHEATSGNPFYLRQLAAAIRSEGGRPTVELARRVRTLGAAAVGRSVLVRLARLGDDCGRLAQATAVLAPGSALRHAAALAGLERGPAQAAADRLRAAGLLVSGPSLSFVHPIVREAIAAELAPSRRAALHLEAGRLLVDEAAPAGLVAAHLVVAEPFGEAWVVDALCLAAREALAQGAPEAALSYLRRARAEPPAPERRLEVLLELGHAEALAPIGHDFPALREALAGADGPQRRAEIAGRLASALIGVARNDDARSLLESVLATSHDLDPTIRERLEAHLIGGGAADLNAQGMPERVARAFARFTRGELREPMTLAALAVTGALTGLRADDIAALAATAIRDKHLHAAWFGSVGAILGLCWTDRLDAASEAADAGIAEAQRRGVAPAFMQFSIVQSHAALRKGELQVAEMHSRRGLELAREFGPAAEQWATMWHIEALLELGRAAEAPALLDTIRLDESLLELWQGIVLLVNRGRVRIALGELGLGVADLLDADRRMAAAGYHLSVLSNWVPDAVQALSGLGRREEAVKLAANELADAIRFGAPRRHGIALSACGMLDDGAQGLAWLYESVATLEHSPARLEHARGLIHLGTGLRARGERKEARACLAQALDIAHSCGGAALAEEARSELIATGGRPRRKALSGPESLTPGELRTARMAAQGLTNREIAQALFVSAKTVDAHLSHAYEKLGIHSRSALPSALSPKSTKDRVPT